MKATIKDNSTSAPSIQEELNKKFNAYLSIQRNISSYLSSLHFQNYLRTKYQMNMIMQMNAFKMHQVYQMYLEQNKILLPQTKLDKDSPCFIPPSVFEGAPEPPKCEVIEEKSQNEQSIIDTNSLCEHSNINPDNNNIIIKEYPEKEKEEEKKENIEIEENSIPVIVVKKQRKNYKCNQCQRNFKTQNAFNSHMNTHNFQCSYCQKLYSEKRILEQHINEKHNNSFVCSIDGKQFKSAAALENHFIAKHQQKKVINQQKKKNNKEKKKTKAKLDDEGIIQAALMN